MVGGETSGTSNTQHRNELSPESGLAVVFKLNKLHIFWGGGGGGGWGEKRGASNTQHRNDKAQQATQDSQLGDSL